MQIKLKKLNPNCQLPSYGHPGDAGLDLFSLETKTLTPGQRHIFMAGFALEIPVGYVGIIKDKSSVSSSGLHTFGGVFDAGYRGEYNAGLVNLTDHDITIEAGQKIAQLVIIPVVEAEILEVAELADSARGTGGFGSTGKF